MKRKFYLLAIFFLLFFVQSCNYGTTRPAAENTGGNGGNTNIVENEPPEEPPAPAPTSETVKTPDVPLTPEKAPTQLASGDWRSVGEGKIELVRNISHQTPTFTAVYLIMGEVFFDIWERTDAIAQYQVTGKGLITYNDKTTLKDCGAWEIVAEGTLSIEGIFNGGPDCELWVTITETWKMPAILTSTCSNIEPAPLTSPFVNQLLKIDYVKNALRRPTFISNETTSQEDIFILRDPYAHEVTGCDVIFEATPIPSGP